MQMIDTNIELPPFIIADFFKHSLVEIADEKAVEEKEAAFTSSILAEQVAEESNNEEIYLGKNLKNVTIVVSVDSAKILNDKDLVFLTNILKACHLSQEDIAIVNQLKTPVTYSYLKEDLQAKYILVFGIEPTEIKLPFIIPHFQVQQYAGSTIIIAPALNEMNKDDADGKILKTKLWLSLQRCFNLDQQHKK